MPERPPSSALADSQEFPLRYRQPQLMRNTDPTHTAVHCYTVTDSGLVHFGNARWLSCGSVMAEFGLVHRYEPSGALHGLMRVRAFTQDDAHVFCTQEQMADECLKINDLILSTYADFGFEGDLTVKLSTRPEKRVGTDEA